MKNFFLFICVAWFAMPLYAQKSFKLASPDGLLVANVDVDNQHIGRAPCRERVTPPA